MLTGIYSHHALPTTRPSPQAPSLASPRSPNQNMPFKVPNYHPLRRTPKVSYPHKTQQPFPLYLHQKPHQIRAFGGAVLGEGMVKHLLLERLCLKYQV